MRYRVTFMERTDGAGKASEVPPDYLALELPDGVVVDKTFVERTEPNAIHNQERMEEDDNFLSVGSEAWEYEVADGREDDFLAAVKNSRMVMDCVPIEDTSESPTI